MPLSDYAGRTPGDGPAGEIRRVSRHHRWNVDGRAAADCARCGAAIDLGERHLLAVVDDGHGSDDLRRYLCDETCLRDWIDDGEA
jgi:hypothetical protein